MSAPKPPSTQPSKDGYSYGDYGDKGGYGDYGDKGGYSGYDDYDGDYYYEDYYPYYLGEKEEKTSPLVLAFGLVPILDLTSALVKYSSYSTSSDADQTTLLYTELAAGTISLFTWGAAMSLGGSIGDALGLISQMQVLAEAGMIYMVARDTNATTSHKNLGFAAHVTGFLIAAVSQVAINEEIEDKEFEDDCDPVYEYCPDVCDPLYEECYYGDEDYD